MYHKGDVQLWWGHEQYLQMTDAREENGYDKDAVKPPCAYLDHSCDSWIIGGRQQVIEMIEDLKLVLHRMNDETAGG